MFQRFCCCITEHTVWKWVCPTTSSSHCSLCGTAIHLFPWVLEAGGTMKATSPTCFGTPAHVFGWLARRWGGATVFGLNMWGFSNSKTTTWVGGVHFNAGGAERTHRNLWVIQGKDNMYWGCILRISTMVLYSSLHPKVHTVHFKHHGASVLHLSEMAVFISSACIIMYKWGKKNKRNVKYHKE